jgi:superoxide dismutase, Cu-Zn family
MQIQMKFIFFLLTMAILPSAMSATMAHAILKAPSLKSLDGHVQIQETKAGLKVVADVSGLKPGAVHGFHIHENNKCEGPDFISAGDHFNPGKHPHSGPAASLKHAGDLGNLVADKNGRARTEVIISPTDIKSLSSLEGKALIIHEQADDLASQPSGDAGDRIACGLIKADKR